MQGTDWKFFLSSKEAWEGMYEACAQAEQSIDFEQFIFLNDDISNRFVELFIKKAGEGVRVRLLLDAAGSYPLLISGIPKRLRKAGVETRFFNTISPWRIVRLPIWIHRDHRKVMVVDSKVAFVGGVGIGDSMSAWRDTQVKVTGSVVHDIEQAFYYMWWIAGKDRFVRAKEPRQTEDGYTVITNSPRFRQRFIHKTLIEVIRSAEKYVYLTTPYFVPDQKFLRVLRLAAKRKVEVKILVPYRSDHPYVDLAANYYFRKALKSGVKFYWYMPEMLHAKTVVVDDSWASIGSSNIDNLSSLFNYELNLVSVDRGFIAELKGHFLQDIQRSHEITKDEWGERPWTQKILELVCAPFGLFF